MSRESTHPQPFFAFLGGGALVLHLLSMAAFVWKGIHSGESPEEEQRSAIAFLFTIALLIIGVLLMNLSRDKKYSGLIYSAMGIIYTVFALVLFSIGAYGTVFQFSSVSVWKDGVVEPALAGLFLGFAIGGPMLIAGRKRREYRWLVYAFAVLYMAFLAMAAYQYVFAGVAIQEKVIGGQLILLLFGGLYMFGLYRVSGMGAPEED